MDREPGACQISYIMVYKRKNKWIWDHIFRVGALKNIQEGQVAVAARIIAPHLYLFPRSDGLVQT